MRRLSGIVIAACAAVASCDASDDGLAKRYTPPSGVVLEAAPTTLRRLTPSQYRNTMRDLLALSDEAAAALSLPQDPGDLPSLLTVSKLDELAAQLVKLGAHRRFVPCDVSGPASAECATKFIADLGSKAFRHPITQEEKDWLGGIYATASPKLGFEGAIDVLARVIFQAPQLVYLHESGEAQPGLPEGLLRVTGYELASRLSYFLWDSMPDDPLLRAAGEKKLATDQGVKEQASRMLADPRARGKIVRLVTQWLELDGTARHVSIEEAVKDPARFPTDGPALRTAMRRELEEFVGRVWDKGGSLGDLLESKDAYVNGPLAKLYGVTGGPADAQTWAWVTLPPSRAGLLTRAAFLLVYANPDIPSPIRRGAAVWRELLCTVFPPPPPAAMDVKISGGEAGAGGQPASIRDTVEAKTMRDPQCSGCHAKINAAGYVFGHFDALGQFTEQETGVTPAGKKYTSPIDATGALTSSDVPGGVDGAVDFSTRLASSRQVKDCIARRTWTAAFGRQAVPQEYTSLQFVQERLASSNSMRDAIAAIVESPAFQYMRRGAP